jgi:hypothetical protein
MAEILLNLPDIANPRRVGKRRGGTFDDGQMNVVSAGRPW